MTLADRPTELPLGNNLDIRFEGTRVGRLIAEDLTFKGFISATRTGGTINAALSAVAAAVGDGSGDYVATVPGVDITTHLASYLHKTVWVVGESVPAGAYRDAFPVRVVQDQGT